MNDQKPDAEAKVFKQKIKKLVKLISTEDI